MVIGIVVIVGAASGVIVFNFILVTWCIFYQRKRRHAKIIELQKHSESWLKGKHVRFAGSVKDSRNKYASYPTSRLPPHVPSPLASARVRTRRSDQSRAGSIFPQKSSTPPVPTLTNHTPSVRSDDTASIYSTASAPLDIHDHWLRSHNSPNTIPVTSACSASEMLSMTVTSSSDPDVVFLPYTGNRLSVVEEGLNPTAYNPVIQQRPSQASRRWRQRQSVSRDQSSWGQTPSRLLSPLLLSPPIAENTEQGSSAPLPSPYSPSSRW